MSIFSAHLGSLGHLVYFNSPRMLIDVRNVLSAASSQKRGDRQMCARLSILAATCAICLDDQTAYTQILERLEPQMDDWEGALGHTAVTRMCRIQMCGMKCYQMMVDLDYDSASSVALEGAQLWLTQNPTQVTNDMIERFS